MSQLSCPKCKALNSLEVFDSETLRCRYCKVYILVERKAGAIVKIAVPGIATLASSVAILGFFGIDSWEELVETLDNIL